MTFLFVCLAISWMCLGALAIILSKPIPDLEDVPPAEEWPHVPEPWHLQYREAEIVTPDRPLPNEHYRGKSIERICWELSEGVR